MSDKTFQSLGVISKGEMTCATFGALLGLSPNAATSRLKILMDKGLIRRKKIAKGAAQRSGSRGRFASFLYFLSAKGRRMHEAATKAPPSS